MGKFIFLFIFEYLMSARFHLCANHDFLLHSHIPFSTCSVWFGSIQCASILSYGFLCCSFYFYYYFVLFSLAFSFVRSLVLSLQIMYNIYISLYIFFAFTKFMSLLVLTSLLWDALTSYCCNPVNRNG